MNTMKDKTDIRDDRIWVRDMIDGLAGLMDSVDADLSNTDQTDMPEVVGGLSDLYYYLDKAQDNLLAAHTEIKKLEQL